MENRNGLPVGAAITRATGTAERGAVLALLDRRRAAQYHLRCGQGLRRDCIGQSLRTRHVTPHIAVDGRVGKLGVIRKTVSRVQWTVLEAAAPTEPRDAPQPA